MKRSNVVCLSGPEESRDILTTVLREGAVKLIKEAVAAELEEFLSQYALEAMPDGRRRIVRNGHLPERRVQTGIGPISIRVPRTRDRGDGEVRFQSKLLPPYLRRAKTVEELLPWLYLRGISTNNFSEVLKGLLGEGTAGLSAATISRLKAGWEKECSEWRKRDLSKSRYVYFWVDGIHCGIRGENDRLCMLVIIGATDKGEKELVALEEGYRESDESWATLLRDLKTRGLKHAPQLAAGDGALGFWKALRKVFPTTREQRCWQHKTTNVLDRLPKSMQAKALEALHEIWQAPSRAMALKAWSTFVREFKDKYPKAVETLEKDKDVLLTFYDFPAEHWKSLRTTNPIESTFATVRHRARQAKGCVSRTTMLALTYKLIMAASEHWNRLAGFERLGQLIEGVRFVDGRSELEQNEKTSQEQDDSRVAA